MFIILSIVLLGLIIIVHELGHFLAAKLFKIGVVEFALGMGPVIASKRIGETVYALRLFPVGGFCAMYGENSVESNGKGDAGTGRKRRPDFKTDWEEDRSFLKASKLKQIGVMLAGPAFNVLLSLAAALLLCLVPGVKLGPPEVAGLSDEIAIAREAGIEPGDRLVAIEDRMVYNHQDMGMYLNTHPALRETGYDLVLKRPDGEVYQVFVIPDKATGLIGIQTAGTDCGGLASIPAAWNLTRHWFLTCTDSLAMLARGDASILDMSSLIGVTSVMGDTMSSSAESASETGRAPAEAVLMTALNLVCFISVNLGIMNLIPIPALDGGRALIAACEGIFKKSVPERVQILANAASFGVLLLLMGVTAIMDVLRITGAIPGF